MKQTLLTLLIVLPLCLAVQSCSPDSEPLMNETERPLPPANPNDGEDDNSDNDNTDDDDPMNRKIIISIGDVHYVATLEDNPTAKAFAVGLSSSDCFHDRNERE